MKICIAQTKPNKGNVSANIEAHKKFIQLALTLNAEAVMFPAIDTPWHQGTPPKIAISPVDAASEMIKGIEDGEY